MKLVTVEELHAWGFPCRLPSDVRVFQSPLGQGIKLTHETIDRGDLWLQLSAAYLHSAEIQKLIDHWYRGPAACAADDLGDPKGKSDWLKANGGDASYQPNLQAEAIRQKIDDAMKQGVFPSLSTDERVILERDRLGRQQHEMAKRAQAPASTKPLRGGWPNIVQADAVPKQYPPEGQANLSSDFGVQASDQLAKAVEPANNHMRVPTHEEREAERARLAEHFRKCGVL